MVPTPRPSPWWRGRWFVRLLGVRVAGQTGDGLVQVALASYTLFSDDQAGAAELAAAAAVVLLPYSLLGPYAGVMLDRWSRRQVLLVGNAVRAAVLAVLTGVVAGGLPALWVYAVALVALGVNRFLLSGLSAALPHTVPAASLTAANAVTPTVGTGAFVVGLSLAGALRGGLVLPAAGDPVLLALASVTYAGAAALALLLPRALLGPNDALRRGRRPRPGHLVAGLADALAHLRSRPWPSAALLALAGMRFWFGLVTVSAVLTLRNGAPDEGAAVAALGVLSALTGAGFLAAAFVAPLLARRRGRAVAATTGLVLAATAPVVPAVLDSTAAWWAAGAILGVGAQTTKICVDAVVQVGVEDDVRGRVFSLYDMLYNTMFVAAAGIAAVVLPASGRSVPVLLVCAVGLLAVAVGFRTTTRAHPAPAQEGRER